FCACLLPAAAVVWLFVRLRNTESRAGRIGYAAAACGVSAIIPGLLAPVFRRPDQSPLLAAFGVLTLIPAVAGIAVAIWAFRARRRDRQGSALYPVLGLVCGAVNLLCGIGIVAMGSRLVVPTGGEPWTWRSEEHGFEVTVPSERWTLRSNPNVPAYFT